MDAPTSNETANTCLERALGYRFKLPHRLIQALRHSSYTNEHVDVDLASNERLEFLGDAVLSLVISHMLMKHRPNLSEGELSRNRAQLVNEAQLADIARQIGIGPHLLLGKGEALTQGREKNSILADAMEAIIAAIYLDGGFDAAFGFVANQFAEQLHSLDRAGDAIDYKSKLQEKVQITHHQVPRYQVIDTSGPDHDKTFRVRMSVAGIVSEGDGKSKKMAEQEAARAGLERLSRST